MFLKNRRTPSSDGFTLIELLVVISIIALLVALLLPALRAARATAQQSVCLQRERQIAIGMAAYQADNGGMFISYTDPPKPWFRTMIQYMGEANNDNPNFSHWFHDWHVCPVMGKSQHGQPDHLTYNQYLGWTQGNPAGGPNEKFRHVYDHQVYKPSLTMMIADGFDRVVITNTDPTGFYFRNLYLDPPTYNYSANVNKHNGTANYVFVDGHGEAIEATAATQLVVPNKYFTLQPFKP